MKALMQGGAVLQGKACERIRALDVQLAAHVGAMILDRSVMDG